MRVVASAMVVVVAGVVAVAVMMVAAVGVVGKVGGVIGCSGSGGGEENGSGSGGGVGGGGGRGCGSGGGGCRQCPLWPPCPPKMSTIILINLSYRLVWATPETIATSAILYLIKFLSYHLTVEPLCFYGTNRKLLKRAF